MHVLIVGTTLSGKTTAARKIAMEARAAGRNVAVLDPLLSPDWPCDFLTNDVGKFMDIARKNRNMHLIIDEAGEYCGQHDKHAYWFATQARHWGHKSIFIGQRATLIARTIRDNCSTLFCFRVSPEDAKTLAQDFCFDELYQAPELPQGVCIYAPRYGEVKQLNFFT